MASCRTIEEHLTAWIDGQLAPRWVARVRDHVETCARCAAEAASLRASIAMQHALLPQVVAADVDPWALHLRVRRALAAEPEPQQSLWRWIFRPLVLAPAAALALVLLLFTVAGGPTDVLAPIGVTAPPPAVRRAPAMFKDYTLIEHLDALENFDTVESEPLDDEQDAQTG